MFINIHLKGSIFVIQIVFNINIFFLFRPDPIYPTPQPDKTAAKCRKDVCQLPDCSCGGKEIPGKIYSFEIAFTKITLFTIIQLLFR